MKKVLHLKRAMRTVLFVLLCVLGIGRIEAQQFTVGDLNYLVNSDGVSVTVTGHVDGTAATGLLTIPDRVYYNETNYEVTTIGVYAFAQYQSLVLESLPYTLKYIEEGAFFNNNGVINSLYIPDNVISIGSYAFALCFEISSVSVGNSLSSIGESAFSGCTSLASVTLGASLTSIGVEAFAACSNLRVISSYNTIPPVLGNSVFSGIPSNATLIVPCGSHLAYFSNWNSFFNYNNIHEDCSPHPITINPSISGGIVTPSVSQAIMGQEIQLFVTPNTGMTLSELIVYNATDPTQVIPVSPISLLEYEFTMPPSGVMVMASFTTGTLVDEIYSDTPVVVNPNPTSGIVKIEAEKIRHISAFNMIGQQIFNGLACGDEFKLDLGNREPGIYFIRIVTASGIITKRVVLTK